MSHLKPETNGSIKLVADRRLFPRAIVKQAAAVVSEHCHVLLDVEEDGSTAVTLSDAEAQDEELRDAAGLLGNLLVSELARRKLDAQTEAARNILLAKALDGALPPRLEEECREEGES